MPTIGDPIDTSRGASLGTIRPSQTIQSAVLEWAQRTQTASILRLLVLASNATSNTHLGICVHFLAKPSVCRILANWANDEPHARALATLSTALLDAGDLLIKFPSIQASKPLADQFRGTVPDQQLLLMMAVRRPGRSPEIQHWFDTLRVWLVLHAVRCATSNPRRDMLVEFCASKIRLAADTESNWLTLAEELKGPSDCFESVSRHLRWMAPRAGASQDESKRFLRTLERLARGESKPVAEPDSRQGLQHDFLVLTSPQALIRPEQQAGWDRPTIWPIHEDEPVLIVPNLGAAVVDASPALSQSERQIVGRGVLLRTVEQLQYLPWSWAKPTSDEESALSFAVETWDKTTDPRLYLLGALFRIAKMTCRSIRTVESLAISDDPSQDWAISTDLTFLHRLPPRRKPGWSSDNRNARWIRPLSDALRIDVKRIIGTQAMPAAARRTLGDLWRQVSPDASAEVTFNAVCRNTDGLQRLSSGMISASLPALAFLSSQDSAFAQLWSSTARTGLGGNCAYASWTTKRVQSILSVEKVECIVSSDADQNAVGSELDPLDVALRESISKAAQKIEQLRHAPQDWIAHHNALTAYVVTSLFAATGTRPVSDSFESPKLFDWLLRRVFVADKVSAGRSGRLVPLTRAANELVADTYCQHLKWLADLLRDVAPSLASEVALLAGKTESKRLPFFFFLRSQPCLSWESVRESTLERLGLFDWPLPWNLMRHRLAIRLRELLLDPEIIDALLGHADQGVMTHCDDSPRIWQNDMQTAQPALDLAYGKLGFAAALPLSTVLSLPSLVVEHDQLLHTNEAFGSSAREATREREKNRQRRRALQQIRAAIGTRTPESVTADEWDALAVRMLTIDTLRPHPFAALRYNLLQRWQRRAASKYRLSIRRVFVVDPGLDSPYRPAAIGSEELLVQLRHWFDDAASLVPYSKVGLRLCLALGALDILLNCRVTSRELLKDVLQGRNFRVVAHQSRAYIEYHPLLQDHPDAPVTRYRISWRAAVWLDKSLTTEYRLDASSLETSGAWSAKLPLIQAVRPETIGGLVTQIAAVVEQANFIQRPGLIAAYQAGRLQTSALPHRNWILQSCARIQADLTATEANRSHDREQVDNSESSDAPDDSLPALPSVIFSRQTRPAGFTEARRSAAIKLTKALRNSISGYRSNGNGKDTLKSREGLANELSRLVAKFAGYISSAMWCLGVWVVHLVKQPRKKDTPYAINTVQRYLSALGQRFIEVGSDFDLLDGDDDAIVDFYDEVLELNRDLDIAYVVGRLQALHRFAQVRFGIEDVDWGELDCGSPMPHGSPGTIGPAQYANALQQLVPTPERAKHENLAAGVLLILAYRFGLRGHDAIGLQAGDWWEKEGMVVIYLQSNSLRRLKRVNSRRIVPLLESLSDHELSVLKNFLGPMAPLRSASRSFPIFARNRKGKCFELSVLRKRVNDVLQATHHDASITLHKARHAFANRVAEALMSDMLRPGSLAEAGEHPSVRSTHVRKLLLGTDNPTRRAPWALCRIIGHWRPATTFRSYVHVIPDWSDQWNDPDLDALDRLQSKSSLPNAVRLDETLGEVWQPRTPTRAVTDTRAVTTAQLVAEYLDYQRHGVSALAAMRLTRIGAAAAARIDAAIDVATLRLRARTDRVGRPAMRSLLSHVSAIEWERILARCVNRVVTTSESGTATTELDFDTGIDLLSSNRQVLMWKPDHFELFSSFVRTMGLSATDLQVRSTSNHKAVSDWRAKAGLDSFVEKDQTTGIQIDAVDTGDPPTQVRHRCAALAKSDAKSSRLSGYGLALLWLIFVTAGSASVEPQQQNADHY